MADARQFAKLDLGYFDNPKVADLVDLSPRAVFLHLRAILYSRQHLTDGRFPTRVVARQVGATVCDTQCQGHCPEHCDFGAAVDAGLIVPLNERTAEVHDYLEHQDSAEQIERRVSAGKDAAARRWGGNGNGLGNSKGIGSPTAEANGRPNAEERRGEESRGEPQTPARADVEALCDHLARRIEENGSKRPTITKKWRDEARLILDRDKRTPEEAHRLIDWCQDSDFWRSNVMSIPTFRAKYDTLRLQAEKNAKGPATSVIDLRPEAWR